DRNNLDVNIALARAVLSVLVLVSWYIDPSYGGWFFIDSTSLIILILHLAYSLATFILIDRGLAASLLPAICPALDITFAAVITIATEGPTSPSWLFFVFAIVVVDWRTGFRATLMVTICSALVYFLLLAAFLPGPANAYVMRAAYLAIIGYLIGFIGAQRARFEARVRDLEAAAERHSIARALHDGYVQVLAGANLRLETCRTLMKTGHSDEVLAKISDLQKALAREYDAVRAYIHALAEVPQIPESKDRPITADTHFEVTANFVGPAPILEQVFQIVLEGVRNSWQHGRAACAAINISTADHLIRIAIDDDGVGFRNSGQPPWAIASRVAEYGGRLRIDGGERPGAHLEIEIPAA
ncbi:MAG TPA: histidine kinase, partial [Candidatus Binatus sp.]|nr:histidine kinase [Candidatus Binatus sp.]